MKTILVHIFGFGLVASMAFVNGHVDAELNDPVIQEDPFSSTRPIMLVPFETDFEQAEGWNVGEVEDISWTSMGTIQVSDQDSASGQQCLLLLQNENESVRLSGAWKIPVEASVIFFDFMVRPTANRNVPTKDGSFSEIPLPLTFMAKAEGVGAVVWLDSLSDQWEATFSDFPVTDFVSNKWIRITYRIDLNAKYCDLYLDGNLEAINIPIRLEGRQLEFSLKGSVLGDVGFDIVCVSEANPLFEDADNDGMDDVLELYMGLDPTVDDRLIDLDKDGRSNIFEYLMGTLARIDDTSSPLKRHVYVDNELGSDEWDGLSAYPMSGGRGPKASLNAVLEITEDNDVMNIMATSRAYDLSVFETKGKDITVRSIGPVVIK